MENKSRCGGCVLISLCGGIPYNFIRDLSTTVATLCPVCLVVTYDKHNIHISKLCPEFYNVLKAWSGIWIPFEHPLCKKNAVSAKKILFAEEDITFEERHHGK